MTWLSEFLTRFKYNQYQPRVPAGYRDGGQWSATGSSREGPSAQRQSTHGQSINRTSKPKPMKKPKPLPRLPSGTPVKPRYVPIADSEANGTSITLKPYRYSVSFGLASPAQLAKPQPEPPPEPPLESVYPIEAVLGGAVARAAARAAAQQVTNALRALRLAIQAERVRRLQQEVREIALEAQAKIREQHLKNRQPDPNKPAAKMKRQMEEGGWTNEEQERVIRTGKIRKSVNKRTGASVTEYHDPLYEPITKDDSRFIAIDDAENYLLQVSRNDGIKPFRSNAPE